VKHSKSETVCQNIKVNGSDVVLDRISYLAVFILFVIQMLLIISGLETNPGPEDDSDIRIGSLNSIDVSSFCEFILPLCKQRPLPHFMWTPVTPKRGMKI
jgi:hypothetical protein